MNVYIIIKWIKLNLFFSVSGLYYIKYNSQIKKHMYLIIIIFIDSILYCL